MSSRTQLENVRFIEYSTGHKAIGLDWDNDRHQRAEIEPPFDADAVGFALIRLARLVAEEKRANAI